MIRLDELIGRGSFGEVYKGQLNTADGLQRRVAVKVLSSEMSHDHRAISRFRDEARLLALLDHPALVPVYALEQIDGRWAVVMGYVDGVEVYRLLRDGPVPPLAAVELCAEVAEALASIWQHPHPDTGEPLHVVHRDIKPQNLMVDGRGRVRLLDLGVARARFETRETATQGGVAGTLAYMSPQRWARVDDGPAGDVYALGATLYQLLTTEVPPQAGLVPDEHERLLASMAEHLEQLEIGEAARAVLPLMAYAVEERPAASDVVGLLRDLASGLPGEDLRSWAAVAVEQSSAQVIQGGPATLSAPLGVHHAAYAGRTIDDQSTFAVDGLDGGDDEVRVWIPPEPRPETIRKRSRGRFTQVLLVLAALLAVALIPRGPAGPALPMGIPPMYDSDALARDVAGFAEWLGEQADRPVQLSVGASYKDVADKLLAGELEYAWLSPYLFLQVQGQGASPVAIIMLDGRSTSEGVLLVSTRLEVTSPVDLVGKRICYSDADSTTGYLLPRAWLRSKGIDPDRDLGESHVSGGHSAMMRDIASGSCDFGGTYPNAYVKATADDSLSDALRLYGNTGRVPSDVLTAGPAADPETTQRLKDALLGLDEGEASGLLGQDSRVSGFVPFDDAAFDDLRQAMKGER